MLEHLESVCAEAIEVDLELPLVCLKISHSYEIVPPGPRTFSEFFKPHGQP